MSQGSVEPREDELTARARSRVGQVLRDKWRLDKLLGVGGMASVYAASHRNGKRGAVKMLHVELSASAESRARFLREGYVANKVDHPGAVSVLDDDVHEGTVFLVMELLEGETVEARAQARPDQRLPVAEVISITSALLDVLAAAHAKGIVHRDLKPENLFLTTKGEVKVLDFGIARFRDGAAQTTGTRTGSVMGTPAFMPPEQALGDTANVDNRTDLWAVGATMYTLLSGRTVHEADTLNKLLLAAMTKPAPPLSQVMPGIAPALAAVVDRALAFNQAQRWPDARAMRAALDASGATATTSGTSYLVPVIGAAPPTFTARSGVTAPPFTREATGRKSAVRPRRAGLVGGFVLGCVVVLGAAIGLGAMRRSSAGAPPAVTAAPETAPSGPAPNAGEPTAAVVAEPPPSTSVAPAASVAPSASVAPAASVTASAAPEVPPAATTSHPARPAHPTPPPPPRPGSPKKKDLFGNY